MSGGDGCQQSNLFFFMEMGARRFHAAERKYIMFKTSVWFPCTKNPDEIGDSNSCYSQIVSSSGLKPPFANRNCCYQSSGSDSNAYYSQMVSSSRSIPPFANRNRCLIFFIESETTKSRKLGNFSDAKMTSRTRVEKMNVG